MSATPLLFLAHRIPFPPNKGDKVRSYHLLRHLSRRYRVFMGTFVDQPEDWQHVDRVRALCAGVHVGRIRPVPARIGSLRGLLSGEALTLPYYRDAGLAAWVREVVADHDIRKAVVFSSAMAQYVMDQAGLRCVVDFCDVDSAKWTQYAPRHRWPLSALYRREGRRLLAFERAVAARAAAAVFVTPAETELFRGLAPEAAAKLTAIGNGVDADYFSPDHDLPSPYPAGEVSIVFTGAMDYWPNIDAVSWFAREVFPAVRRVHPTAVFYVVGMNPAPAVQALAQPGAVSVTGRVADVRPYLKHARVVVAPLRVARGIQNKVLEAMAMARPVVASRECAGGLTAVAGSEFVAASTPEEYVAQIGRLIGGGDADRIGRAARLRVLADYSWEASLSRLDPLLDETPLDAAEALHG